MTGWFGRVDRKKKRNIAVSGLVAPLLFFKKKSYANYIVSNRHHYHFLLLE